MEELDILVCGFCAVIIFMDYFLVLCGFCVVTSGLFSGSA